MTRVPEIKSRPTAGQKGGPRDLSHQYEDPIIPQPGRINGHAEFVRAPE